MHIAFSLYCTLYRDREELLRWRPKEKYKLKKVKSLKPSDMIATDFHAREFLSN